MFLEVLTHMSHQSSPLKKLPCHGGCWLFLGQEAPGNAGSRVARDRWAQPSGDWAPRSSLFDVVGAWINPFEARSPTLMVLILNGYWVIAFSCFYFFLLLFILFFSPISIKMAYHIDRSCSRHGPRTPCFVTWLSEMFGALVWLLTLQREAWFMTSWHAFSRSRLQVGGSPYQWSNSSEVGEFGFGRPHSKACCLLCSEALTQILQKNLGIQSLNAADSHLHMISICKVGKS